MPIVAFDPDHPMYDWLYSRFRMLSPQEWRDELPRKLSEEVVAD